MTIGKIEKLIEKYWEGETSLAEEKEIREFIRKDNSPQFRKLKMMFGFFEEEGTVEYTGTLKAHATKVIKMNLFRNIAVAASMILIVGLGILYQTTNKPVVAENFEYGQIDDPELALEITKDALAFISFNINSAQESLSGSIENLESLNIINSR
jgi:hypothetical protein